MAGFQSFPPGWFNNEGVNVGLDGEVVLAYWRECMGCHRELLTVDTDPYFFCDECQRASQERAKYLAGLPRLPRTAKYSKAPIPDRVRWAVWERDNFTCRECGSRHYLTVDHIVPESKGGTLDLDNLQTLCRSCNSRKGARQ